MLAVDPGDRHVGVAVWKKKTGVTSVELDAEAAPASIRRLLSSGNVQVLVIEEFVLYPDKMRSLIGGSMRTSEMIGALRWIATELRIPSIMQGAGVKDPTRKQCEARGLEWHDTASGHSSDARLHLFHYLLKEKLIKRGKP